MSHAFYLPGILFGMAAIVLTILLIFSPFNWPDFFKRMLLSLLITFIIFPILSGAVFLPARFFPL